jgi:hypothetical protein
MQIRCNMWQKMMLHTDCTAFCFHIWISHSMTSLYSCFQFSVCISKSLMEGVVYITVLLYFHPIWSILCEKFIYIFGHIRVLMYVQCLM